MANRFRRNSKTANTDCIPLFPVITSRYLHTCLYAVSLHACITQTRRSHRYFLQLHSAPAYLSVNMSLCQSTRSQSCLSLSHYLCVFGLLKGKLTPESNREKLWDNRQISGMQSGILLHTVIFYSESDNQWFYSLCR